MDEKQQGVQLIESEEDKKKKTSPAQSGPAFVSTGPSAPSTPSGTQQARAAQAAGPTRGTGFTGVGRFLQANVGSRLGQEVAGRVSQAGQQAASRLGQATGQFQQQLVGQAGQLSEQQQAAQAALRRISSVQPGVPLLPSEKERSAYETVAGGQISAPVGLQDVGDIRSQAAMAAKLAEATQTAKGRVGLLKQSVGGGARQYTPGQAALDALVLGQAGSELAQARRASAGLQRRVGTQEDLANEQIREFKARAAESALGLKTQAGELEKTISKDILDKQKAYGSEQERILGMISQQIPTGTITQELSDILSQYGIDPKTRIYDRDFSELATFLSKSKGPADVLTSTTQQQAAQLEALKKLSGLGKEYTEEEKKKIGTTLDPTKGLDISPEEFKSRFVSSGQQRVSDAAKSLASEIPELQPILNNVILSGTFQSNKKAGTSDEDKLKEINETLLAQQSQLQRDINSYRSSYEREKNKNKEPSFLERLRNEIFGGGSVIPRSSDEEAFFANKIYETQTALNALNKKQSAMNAFLNEYGKGQSLSVSPGK